MSESVGTRPASPLDTWALDPDVVHLNHGSFGGCPRAVVDASLAIRARLEAAPMRFYLLDWQRELDHARGAVATFVGADPARLVFVPGATAGVAIALASAHLASGDEIVTTTHVYPACKYQLARLADRIGARVVMVPVDLPFDPDAIVDAIAAAITPRTKLALLDHVTSPTALVLPIERLVPLFRARGIPVIVDGAHAPGQIAIDVDAIGASWYVGNHHKWMCAPKASGFLAIAADAVAQTQPLITSHGASPAYGPANRLHAELDWSGTYDPSAQLAVPVAIDTIARMGDALGAGAGGWPAVIARNHALAVAMRERLGGELAPAASIGTMATVRIELPAGVAAPELEKQLLVEGWEVPIVASPLGLFVRVSAHLYNHLDQIDALVAKLGSLGVRVTR
ncbi:MAG: aminotransferase class V-fold PLP-dependent enzyme [Kofleriaceae bacterium]